MYNITFQQIDVFLNIAKHLNLSKASEALFRSQPSLSRTLKKFEESVGMQLFNRSNQGMSLTREGQELYNKLEPLYKNMDHSIQTVQNSSDSPLKVLRIVQPSAYDFADDFKLLKQIVKAYEQRYPDVVLHEHLCDFRDLRHELQFGNIDFAFTEDFGIRDLQDISIHRLVRINMYIALSSSHFFAQSDKQDFSRLDNETVFTLRTMADEEEDIKTQLNACLCIGFTPKKVEFMPNFNTIVHAVSKGKGISFSSRMHNLGLNDNIMFCPIKLPIMPYISVAWRTGRLNKEAQNFVDLLPTEGQNAAAATRGTMPEPN